MLRGRGMPSWLPFTHHRPGAMGCRSLWGWTVQASDMVGLQGEGGTGL